MGNRYGLSVIVIASLLSGACGSSAADEVAGSGNSLQPGAAAPDAHQIAQASFDAVDNAATHDASLLSQAQSATKALSATRTDSSIARANQPGSPATGPRLGQAKQSVGADLSALFDVQGCTARVSGVLGSGAGGLSFDGNIIFNPNGCVLSRNIAGSAKLQAYSASGVRHTEITADMTQTLVNGDQVHVASALAGQPTYILAAADPALQGNTHLSLSVAEHRRRVASTGQVVYDVTIATDTNALLQIVNTYAADANTAQSGVHNYERTIVFGVNTVVHNMAHYTAVHTFRNLHHTLGMCNCPDAGSLQEVVRYADAALGAYSRTYTFKACGEAEVVTSTSTHPNVTVGTTQVTWDSCH
jgi:hypothetical protein